MVRALHYVFKIGNRRKSYDFFTKVLKMKIQRHEEFNEGCKATCNGPYAGRWSKTMVGYGPEDTHFVFELTYNYGIHSYDLGNDFHGVHIEDSDVFEHIKNLKICTKTTEEELQLEDPDGHMFFIKKGNRLMDPVSKVSLNTECLDETIHYWQDFHGVKVVSKNSDSCILVFGDNQCQLEWILINSSLTRGSGFGRIAFSVPFAELCELAKTVEHKNRLILTPLTTLETDSKASVTVIILSDPNEHEICFVDDESFRKLSVPDKNGDTLLLHSISDE